MTAFNFKARFVEPIEDGTKLQTMRAPRKDGRLPKPDSELQLYYAMRTRQCRLVARKPCTGAFPVHLNFLMDHVRVGTKLLEIGKPRELDWFARRDGFRDWADLRTWWYDEHGPRTGWRGNLIDWGKLEENGP